MRDYAKIFYLYDPNDTQTCPYFHEFVNGDKNAVYQARVEGFTFLLKPVKTCAHAPKPGIVRWKRIDVTRAHPRKDISIGLIEPKEPEPPQKAVPAPPPPEEFPKDLFGTPTAGKQIEIKV